MMLGRCIGPIRSGYDVLRIFAAVVLLTAAYMLLCGCVCAAVADPLVIKPATVDFGRVNDSSGPLKLSFTVVNRSDKPIEITGARSGCGCTVAEVEQVRRAAAR